MGLISFSRCNTSLISNFGQDVQLDIDAGNQALPLFVDIVRTHELNNEQFLPLVYEYFRGTSKSFI
jgi:hypothetical protein